MRMLNVRGWGFHCLPRGQAEGVVLPGLSLVLARRNTTRGTVPETRDCHPGGSGPYFRGSQSVVGQKHTVINFREMGAFSSKTL